MNAKDIITNDDNTLDIIELIKMFWKHKIIIITLVIVCIFMMVIRTTYFTDDMYTSSGILYVSNRKEIPDEYDAILKSDIDTSRTLSTTYIEILKTSYFLEEVGEELDLDYTWKDISGMVNITSINETELLKVATTAPDPQEAYDITKEILEKAPDKLRTVYKKGEVAIVDSPRVPTAENDKGLAKNALLGAVLGFILGALYVFVNSFFDTKVRNSEDLAKRYDVPVLGVISE
jgi:capsular polysaccharide biosynthesis protein